MAVKLEPYRGGKTRHRCPNCGKVREFTRYIDENGEYIADHVGRCNNENKCGYHYTPKQYFNDNPEAIKAGFEPAHFVTPPKTEKPISYLPIEFLEASISVPYRSNKLYWWMESTFGTEATREAFLKYMVGTSAKKWPGATAYWQVDFNRKVRQCKLIEYDCITGKRIKDREDKKDVLFMGRELMRYRDVRLEQCFFGEHLLSEHPTDTVAIVESEKTALICSIAYPTMIWLAAGGVHGCKWKSEPETVCKHLANRKVVLFPDLNATEKWKVIANKINQVVDCNIIVSDELESIASDEDRAAGLDIADYLIKEQLIDNS